MVKKKGFTLVELLAVIVILAIIALIATPLILNVIDNAKKGAFKSSVLGIMESAELYKVLNPNDSTADSDIIFTCNGTSCKSGDKELSIKGSIPVAGTVTISKYGVSVTDITDLKYIANGTKEELTIIKASDRNDTTPPVINKEKITIKTTSSSITVLINEDAAIDQETGISKYTVNIYDSNDNKTTKTRNNIGSIEFKELTSGEYKIEVIATNGNNLESKENLDNVTTDVIDEPTYSVSPTGWAQSKEITITYPSGYTNEYSLDGTTWLEYKDPITLTENGTIRARVTDGTNYVIGSTFTVDQIDTTSPELSIGEVTSTSNSITIAITSNDSESGINELTCKYGISEGDYTESASNVTDASCNITGLTQAKVYYYELCVSDNAENPKCITGNKETLRTYFEDGTAVYFNAETGLKCTEIDYNNNLTADNQGNTSGCLKWYTFLDNESATNVNLILNHNSSSDAIKWNSNTTNTEMKEVKEELTSNVSGWNDEVKATARLIKANEIASITNKTSFSGIDSDWFYISSVSGNYKWLYENFQGSVLGYWTSTPVSLDSVRAWRVGNDSSLYCDSVIMNVYGVRPVITVVKDKIK